MSVEDGGPRSLLMSSIGVHFVLIYDLKNASSLDSGLDTERGVNWLNVLRGATDNSVREISRPWHWFTLQELRPPEQRQLPVVRCQSILHKQFVIHFKSNIGCDVCTTFTDRLSVHSLGIEKLPQPEEPTAGVHQVPRIETDVDWGV